MNSGIEFLYLYIVIMTSLQQSSKAVNLFVNFILLQSFISSPLFQQIKRLSVFLTNHSLFILKICHTKFLRVTHNRYIIIDSFLNMEKNSGKRDRSKKKQSDKPQKSEKLKREENKQERIKEKNYIANKAKKKMQSKQSEAKQSQTKKNQREKQDIQVSKYVVELGNFLGKGQFASVYKAHLKQRPDEVFACKVISSSIFDRDNVYRTSETPSMIQRIEAQIKTQKALSDFKHIVKLHDCVKIQGDAYYIFMEMCSIDLAKYIQQKDNRLSEKEALDFFQQLLKGYKFLYDRGISHRDLKPQNLLIEGKTLKISDFGGVKTGENVEQIIKSIHKGANLTGSAVGTVTYMAPQILRISQQKKLYNPTQSDIWSMGVILYKMLYGSQPYKAEKLLKLRQNQVLVIPAEPQVSAKTEKLLKSMLVLNPEQRIKFGQLYEQEVKDDGEVTSPKQGPSSQIYSEKQRILVFYNMMLTKISKDCAQHATLRQLGIEAYQKYSAKLMTLIHQKRTSLLKNSKQINAEIVREIKKYSQDFYLHVKQTFEGSAISEKLGDQLQLFKNCLKQYKQLDMLHKQIQYFILLLLLLYNYEKQNVSIDYIFTILKEKKMMNLRKVEELIKTNLQHK